MSRTEAPSETNHEQLRDTTATQRQEGFSLVEVLIALAIVATVVGMFMGSLTTDSRTVALIYERTTAENLARSQLEYTKSQNYISAPSSYTTIASLPSDFAISAQASPVAGRDNNIQKIIVTVYRNGKSILSIESFKVKR